MQIITGTFHFVKISGISGSVVNGTHFVGSSHWKIPRKSGKSKEVGPFSHFEFPNGILSSIYMFLVVCTISRSTVGHRGVPGFTTKWNNLLPIDNSTFAPTKISAFFPKWKAPNLWTCCPAWSAKTKLRMAKGIATVCGIFLEGRRQTLLYSCKWQW